MTERTSVRRRPSRARLHDLILVSATVAAGTACFRGTLPPRQFYRLSVPDSALTAPAREAPPLSGSIAIARYDAPGIYGTGSLIYRVGSSSYGAYPAREWAIPLGEMLARMTEQVVRRRGLTSGRILFDPGSARTDAYEWRGTIREFDEVDAPTSVTASVILAVQLVRVADDSIVWSGTAANVQAITPSRSIEAVVDGLSTAAVRALERLADDASAALRRATAAGAQTR